MNEELSVEVPTKWWKLISTNNGFGMSFTDLDQDIRTDLADFEYTEVPPRIARKSPDTLKHGVVHKGYLVFNTPEEAVRFILTWGDVIANDRFTWQRA